MSKKLTILIILIATRSNAQFYKGGGGPDAFYQFSFTPRETAMGGTGAASTQGVFAPFWNPAGIVTLVDTTRWQISLGIVSRTNAPEVQDMGSLDFGNNVDFFNLGFSLQPKNKNYSFAINVLHFAVTGIHETRLNEYDEIEDKGKFNSSEWLGILSYAIKREGLDLGASTKLTCKQFIHSNQFKIFSGADLGVKFLIVRSLWLFNHIDSGTFLKLNRDNRNTEINIVSDFSGHSGGLDQSILINASFSAGNFSPFKLAIGTELTMNNLPFPSTAFIRAGVHHRGEVSFGLGIQEGGLNMDIAYSFDLWGDAQYYALVDTPLKLGLAYNFGL